MELKITMLELIKQGSLNPAIKGGFLSRLGIAMWLFCKELRGSLIVVSRFEVRKLR
jgi:hypothetical protein